jgi:hypothetical protein
MDATVSRELHKWKAVAQDLGIEIEAPFSLDHHDSQFTYVARLPQFGSSRGMLVMPINEPAAAVAATDNGFGYSVVELGSDIDREAVIEMLREWGWARSEMAAPEWCREV